ncbi:hypothetical protein H9W95_03840 [Flavobacterium lindanitolerans]|nr:hypothetical protein [Flavobacterium lindanitolerans]
MKIYSYILLVLFCFLVSCKDDEAARLQANAKDAKKNEQIFASIDKAWNFNPQPMNPTVVTMIQNWSEWRLFMTELQQKPKSSIGAFQQKARTLSQKAMNLNNNIPAAFDKPEIKSRIMTLITKVRSLDLFINLNQIQEQKVIKLIPKSMKNWLRYNPKWMKLSEKVKSVWKKVKQKCFVHWPKIHYKNHNLSQKPSKTKQFYTTRRYCSNLKPKTKKSIV